MKTEAQQNIKDYRSETERWLKDEKQFHLGIIPTEQSNPITAELSKILAKDTKAGIQNLLEVDQAVVKRAREVIKRKEYIKLIERLRYCLESDQKICFSGCGASGRLSVQLDATWREFWDKAQEVLPNQAQLFQQKRKLSCSIITGGDRAVVRSVEDFEDYISFGRRQVVDLEINQGDLLLSLAEGGMASSAIGTALEAADRGAYTYYIFANPSHVLYDNLERCRKALSHPGIVPFELYVGPMAVTGSTRMQVTTIELLILGSALEIVLSEWCKEHLSSKEQSALNLLSLTPSQYIDIFENLVDNLSKGEGLEGLSQMVELEASVYKEKGLVTYVTHDYLLDIFTDTTERTPTFSLPPFRRINDTESPVSWAYAKDPLFPAKETWEKMLRRPVRGLDWSREDYIAMGASEKILSTRQTVGTEDCYEYSFGNEDDPSRYSRKPCILVMIDIFGSANPAVRQWVSQWGKNFSSVYTLIFGPLQNNSPIGRAITLPLKVPQTITNLPIHLLVKIAFNVFSTATMAKLGRIWGNWMIQVEPTNKKLIDRSIRIIANLAKLDYQTAAYEFFKTYYNTSVKRSERVESFVVETLKRLGVSG